MGRKLFALVIFSIAALVITCHDFFGHHHHGTHIESAGHHHEHGHDYDGVPESEKNPVNLLSLMHNTITPVQMLSLSYPGLESVDSAHVATSVITDFLQYPLPQTANPYPPPAPYCEELQYTPSGLRAPPRA